MLTSRVKANLVAKSKAQALRLKRQALGTSALPANQHEQKKREKSGKKMPSTG
jgi:hypothetical protein